MTLVHLATAVACIIVATGAFMAMWVAPNRLRLTRVDAPIHDLAEPFVGYTIAVLSDLHYGGTRAPGAVVRQAVALTRATRPDVIVLLGDYGISYWAIPRTSRRLYAWAMRALAPILRELHAPDGVIATIGNHDHEGDLGAVRDWLRALGALVLVNDHVLVARGDARLAIAAVDDYKYGAIDARRALAGVPDDVPRIVLSHNPDGVRALAPDVRVDLVLAGHTHGGQVVLPWLGAPLRHATVCGRHTASGWVPNARAPLYVSRGVGSMMPIRISCPPEVVAVRLVRA